MPVTRTTSNSSGRVIAKCAHSRLTTTLPAAARRASISSLITDTHEPQPVPAFVHFLTPATSSKPSSTAARMAPQETLWHEQMPASSGRSAGPAPSTGAGRAQQGEHVRRHDGAAHGLDEHRVRTDVADQHSTEHPAGRRP